MTLGWREARDIRVVLKWLTARNDVSAVALWGQSMGAAAAIYYQGISPPKDPNWPRASCVVLDSPYSDFGQLATRTRGAGTKTKEPRGDVAFERRPRDRKGTREGGAPTPFGP